MAKLSKRRFAEDANEVVDQETEQFMLQCSERLEHLLSESVVECEINTTEPLFLRHSVVEPGLVLYSIDHSVECNQTNTHLRKKPDLHRHKFEEEITAEDLAAISVTSEWVLNKKGVYTTGRERKSELITGASHSPTLKKIISDSKSNKKPAK